MSLITAIIEVNRPVENVFAYATNPTRLASGSTGS
jgi:hypothetical protein